MTKIFKKIKLLVLTAVAGFTALSTVGGIKAAKAEDAKSYVALGDVRTTGYVFGDYSGVENNGFGNDCDHSFAHIFSENGEYFADVAPFVEFLAADCFRVEDIYFELAGPRSANLLADDFYKETYMAAGGKNAMFASALHLTGDANEAVHEYFVEAVSNADVITLDAGLNGYIKYVSKVMHEYLENDKLFEHLPYSNVFAEPIRAILNKALESNLFTAALIKVCDEYLDLDLFDILELNLPRFVRDAAQLILDAYVSYCTYVNATTELIYKLNKDVDLVVIGMSNPVKNMHVKVDGQDINVGHFFDSLIQLANTYCKVGTTMAGKYFFVDPLNLDVDTELNDDCTVTELYDGHDALAGLVNSVLVSGESAREVFVKKVINEVNEVLAEVLQVALNKVFDLEETAGDAESVIGSIIGGIQTDVEDATEAIEVLLANIEYTISTITDFLLGDPTIELDGKLGSLITFVNDRMEWIPGDVLYFINYFVLSPIEDALAQVDYQITVVAEIIKDKIGKFTSLVSNTIRYIADLPEKIFTEFALSFHDPKFIEFYQMEVEEQVAIVSEELSRVFVEMKEQIEAVVKQAISLPYYPIYFIRSVLTQYIINSLQEHPLDSAKIAYYFVNLFGEDIKALMEEIKNSPWMSEEAKYIYDVLFNMEDVIDANVEEFLASDNAVTRVLAVLDEIIKAIDEEVSPVLVGMFNSFIESIEHLFPHNYHIERETVDGEVKFFAVCDDCGMRGEIKPEYVWEKTSAGNDMKCKVKWTYPDGTTDYEYAEDVIIYGPITPVEFSVVEGGYTISGSDILVKPEYIKEGSVTYIAYFSEDGHEGFTFKNQVKTFPLTIRSLFFSSSSGESNQYIYLTIGEKYNGSLIFDADQINGYSENVSLRPNGTYSYNCVIEDYDSYDFYEYDIEFSKEMSCYYTISDVSYSWAEDGRSCIATGTTNIKGVLYTITETASLDNGKIRLEDGYFITKFTNNKFNNVRYSYSYDIVVNTTKEFSADCTKCTQTDVYSLNDKNNTYLYTVVKTFDIVGVQVKDSVNENGVIALNGGVEIAFDEKSLSSISSSAKLYADVSEDGKTLNIDIRDGEEKETFDGEVTITMPFDEEVPEGYQVKVYCVDGEEPVDMYATIDENGNVVFTTTHFSTYKIVVEEIPAEPAAPEKAGLGLWWILIAAVALICVASLVYVFVIRPRGKKAKKETK